MGESTSYSMMGSVLKETQDREGVRIDAPHGWVINDVHHLWNKNETYHWETGNIFHMTSGQVYHANLNVAEVHTTTNALTMHVDLSPLHVHLNQMAAGIQFHYEPDSRIRKYHVHGGHLINVDNHFATEAHEIELHATKKLGLMGTMALEAGGAMTLESKSSIALESSSGNNKASLSLSGTDGNATLHSKNTTAVSGSTKTLVLGGDSTILLKNNSLELQSGSTTVSLSPGKLATNGSDTKLNGKVTIGQPAISGMATTFDIRWVELEANDTNAEIAALKAQVAALRARLP